MDAISTQSPGKIQKVNLKHPRNFLLSQELVGRLQPKSRVQQYTRPSRNMISKSDCVPIRHDSCDLKIDLLVDFRSLLRDVTHWKLNQAVTQSQTKSSHNSHRRTIKVQDEGRYRYCSLTEGLESLRLKPLRSETVKSNLQSRFKSSSDNASKSQQFQKQSKPENRTNQKTEGDQLMLSTIALSKLKIQISPSKGDQNYLQSFSRQTVEQSIIQPETEHQLTPHVKSELEKSQPAVTLKTRIVENHFQGGYQTLPIRPNEHDISIQCSEGDLISQMDDIREVPVQKEMFGVEKNLPWSYPKIRFNNRPKLHQALKLKLVDPFHSQVPINQMWRQRIQNNDRLVLSKELHKSLEGLPMSPQQKLQNFETILFSRRPKVSTRTDL